MLDKFDSDSEDTSAKYQSDIQRIASRYSHSSGTIRKVIGRLTKSSAEGTRLSHETNNVLIF